MRRTILSEYQYEKKFMAPAIASAMTIPLLPPMTLPTQRMNAVMMARRIVVRI
jgi:hypothetical protein